MRIFIAYISVISIWATTPLAIHWSNTDFSYPVALAWRMVCSGLIGVLLLKLWGQRLVENSRDWVNFFAGSLGIFPTMLFVYWAAKSVPSGIMSVVFGLFPFFVGLWTHLLYRENILTKKRIIALVVALVGLMLINIDQFAIHHHSGWGIGAILFAVTMWSLSSVWLKRLPAVPPLRQSVGTAVIVMPIFAAILLLSSDAMPDQLGMRSLFGVSYLVVAGSLLGHTLFFYVLARCSVATVALIPLITPVIALWLGWLVEGDSIAMMALLGALMIVFALGIYQGLGGQVFRAVMKLRK